VVDKLQDNAASARGVGVTFIPTVFGRPHLIAAHSRRWRPVVQYPVTGAGEIGGAGDAHSQEPLPLEIVERRLGALAHPVRLRLVRTLTRSPRTTGELAFAWDLTAPEVSRHLAVLRSAGLLTAERRGRHVHYSVDLTALTALGADLLAAMLR